jgi:hypothetical protein
MLPEAAKVTFADRKFFRGLIQRSIRFLVDLFEMAVVVFGFPEIEREVNSRTGEVLQELSLPEVGIVLEKLNPGSLGAIDLFEGLLFSRLDFELP